MKIRKSATPRKKSSRRSRVEEALTASRLLPPTAVLERLGGRSAATRGRHGAEGERRTPWCRSGTRSNQQITRLLTASAAATPATRPAIIHDALRGVDCRDAAYLDHICARTACVRGHDKIFKVRVIDKDEPTCRDQRLERRTGIGAESTPAARAEEPKQIIVATVKTNWFMVATFTSAPGPPGPGSA